MVDVYSKTSIESLPLRLQEDEWRIVSVPNRYYNTLGEILYGGSFSKRTLSTMQTSSPLSESYSLVPSCSKETPAS
jgi:hypothetical protein